MRTRATAELAGMHVKYRATPRKAFPRRHNPNAEATGLGPSTANCTMGALDPQEAPVEAAMADLRGLKEPKRLSVDSSPTPGT